jgi:translation initiation factor IF-3
LSQFREVKNISREEHILNNRIKVKELRVITADGENLGILNTSDALKEAQKREQDLLIVSPQANPPVAKILDYTKFLYEERKKKKGGGGKKVEVKEFRMTPTTGQGDIDRFVRRSRGFMKEGHKIKISVKMRGREALFPEMAQEKIDAFIKGVEDVAKQEAPVKRLGNMLTATFTLK